MSVCQFPPGTSVCVRQTIQRRDGPVEAQVTGVVEAWEEQPTGSWYASVTPPSCGRATTTGQRPPGGPGAAGTRYPVARACPGPDRAPRMLWEQ